MDSEGNREYVVGFNCHIFVGGVRKARMEQVKGVWAVNAAQAGRLAARRLPKQVKYNGKEVELHVDSQSFCRMSEGEL